jgi:tRNA uridine 5-carboxymethylaminomethyl modification enzyme
VTPGSGVARSLESAHGISISKEARALDLLKRPEMDYDKLVSLEGVGPGVADAAVAEQVEIQLRYSGYLNRQKEDIERRLRHEGTEIASDFDYSVVRGLSSEVREKLERVRPDTVGQASRIPGMTPAAISLLLVHLKKSRQKVA